MKRKTEGFSRRDFLKQSAGAVGIAAAGPFFLFPDRAWAAQKTLRILQWKHFVPGYDQWFDNVFAKEWGRKQDTKVIIDYISLEQIHARAAAEIKARKGHDLVMFTSPPARYEKYAINHAEVHQEVWGKQGQVNQLGYKSSYNPRTKRFFAFADSYIPTPFHYRRDYWQQIGVSFGPSNYDSLLSGARQIREKLGVTCGLGLGPELDSNIALHGILLSFGGSVQNAEGNVTINSKGTIEALKYVKALYREAGTPGTFNWNSHSNDRKLIDGRVSFTMNAISTVRQAERENRPRSQHVMINPALRGPVRWQSHPHITSCYVIWEFAKNKESAIQFLTDLAVNLGAVFKASGFCNLPCFPKAVPDLKVQLENDPNAEPHHKYAPLEDALVWTTNIGYPGYATAAIDELFTSFVIPRMFAAVVRGELSPEEGAAAAEKEAKTVFEKWRARKA